MRIFLRFFQDAIELGPRFHYAMQKHRCVPWFLPKGERMDGDIDFCGKAESISFKKSMDDFLLNSTTPRDSLVPDLF